MQNGIIQKMSSPSDYIAINSYVYTTADITGKTDYWATQWALLVVASVIITIIIIYRWHFSKGGTLSDWIEVVREEEAKAEEAKAEQKEIATQCSGQTEM